MDYTMNPPPTPRWQKPVGMLAILALIAIWCIAVGRTLAGIGATAVLRRDRDRVALATADAAHAALDGNRGVEVAPYSGYVSHHERGTRSL
jgi:hypothetical protein